MADVDVMSFTRNDEKHLLELMIAGNAQIRYRRTEETRRAGTLHDIWPSTTFAPCCVR